MFKVLGVQNRSIMSRSNENISVMASPKQPLKRFEIPLCKFNDVAIPHHVDLLKKHKSNIEKVKIVPCVHVFLNPIVLNKFGPFCFVFLFSVMCQN